MYSEFYEMRRELCALCRYFKEKKRETGKDKYKFTENTILTNYVVPIASLDEKLFKNLIRELVKLDYIKVDKRSYRFTLSGEVLYDKIKEEGYEC